MGQREGQKSVTSAHFPALIRGRVAPGAPLFSALNGRNFDRTLKAALAQTGAPEAHRYSPMASAGAPIRN